MSLLENFKKFFSDYLRVWNLCKAEDMNAVLSKDLEVRWAYPGNTVSHWGYEEACEGWRQAYKSYEGHNPKWSFKELAITPISGNEVLAAFWVRFEQDGRMTADACLFVQAFRFDNGSWKLIRENVDCFTTQNLGQEVIDLVTA